MNVCFFFSYSEGGCEGYRQMVSKTMARKKGINDAADVRTSSLMIDPFLNGLPGSEAVSLFSDMLVLGLLAFPVLFDLCWNFTSFLGFVMFLVWGLSRERDAS